MDSLAHAYILISIILRIPYRKSMRKNMLSDWNKNNIIMLFSLNYCLLTKRHEYFLHSIKHYVDSHYLSMNSHSIMSNFNLESYLKDFLLLSTF